jgi:hypothetical protein
MRDGANSKHQCGKKEKTGPEGGNGFKGQLLSVSQAEEALAQNAFDFLERSIDEFDTDLKRSVIDFYLGLELVFKARLMKEHWSLICEKPGETSIAQFQSGNFKSVSLNEAAKRLETVCNESHASKSFEFFTHLRNHRNKMVHFFHEADIDEKVRDQVATDQVRSWHALQEIFASKWQSILPEMADKLTNFDHKMRGVRKYLRTRFADLAPEIKRRKNTGSRFMKCNSCTLISTEFPAWKNEGLLAGTCLVCGYGRNVVCTECQECRKHTILEPNNIASCNHCAKAIDVEEALGAQYADWSSGEDVYEADCPECGEHLSVKQCDIYEGYVCCNCFETFNELFQCEYCGGCTTTDNPDSYLEGCENCEGRWGNDKD